MTCRNHRIASVDKLKFVCIVVIVQQIGIDTNTQPVIHEFFSKKQGEFEEMDRIIRQRPGISQAELARELGVAPSTISRRLPSVEEAGYLYSEDDQGGLWPFKR